MILRSGPFLLWRCDILLTAKIEGGRKSGKGRWREVPSWREVLNKTRWIPVKSRPLSVTIFTDEPDNFFYTEY